MDVKTKILETLNSDAAKQVSFKIENIQINGRTDYPMIANMIREGKIQVVQTPLKSPDEGEYRPDRATILVGMTTYDDLMIHECTHAIQDVRGIPTNRLASEAVAYVAQLMYRLKKNNID